MATPDGDWVCSDGGLFSPCFAVWQDCDCVWNDCPSGMVPRGDGLPLSETKGTSVYASCFEDGETERLNYDVCPTCTGTAGGYACGVCDLELDPAGFGLPATEAEVI